MEYVPKILQIVVIIIIMLRKFYIPIYHYSKFTIRRKYSWWRELIKT